MDYQAAVDFLRGINDMYGKKTTFEANERGNFHFTEEGYERHRKWAPMTTAIRKKDGGNFFRAWPLAVIILVNLNFDDA